MIQVLCVFLLVLFLGGLYLFIRNAPVMRGDVPASLWVYGVCLAFNFITGILVVGAFGGFN